MRNIMKTGLIALAGFVAAAFATFVSPASACETGGNQCTDTTNTTTWFADLDAGFAGFGTGVRQAPEGSEGYIKIVKEGYATVDAEFNANLGLCPGGCPEDGGWNLHAAAGETVNSWGGVLSTAPGETSLYNAGAAAASISATVGTN